VWCCVLIQCAHAGISIVMWSQIYVWDLVHSTEFGSEWSLCLMLASCGTTGNLRSRIHIFCQMS
jgi:hypothetical protein